MSGNCRYDSIVFLLLTRQGSWLFSIALLYVPIIGISPLGVTFGLIIVFVMEYRTLGRYYLFNKAMARVKRVHPCITASCIHFLYSVYVLGGSDVFVGYSTVERHLRAVHRSTKAYRWVRDGLHLLADAGYLVKKEGYCRFRLTVAGINLLNEFEKVLKSVRL